MFGTGILMLYRTYRSVPYRYWCYTELPRSPLPVVPAVCLCMYRAEHTLVKSNLRTISNGIYWTINDTNHFSIWPHKPRERVDDDVNRVPGSSCSSRNVGITRVAWVGVFSSRFFIRLVCTYSNIYIYLEVYNICIQTIYRSWRQFIRR